MILLGDYAPDCHTVCAPSFDSTVLINLEGPILLQDTPKKPAPKAGPHLSATQLPTFSGNTLFALANNHLMDYGAAGLEATLLAIGAAGHQSCGAGHNLEAARQARIIEENNVTIGVIACCEAQFGLATASSAGVAEFGPWLFPAIQRLRASVDVLIVSVHASVETSPWPFPYIRELYRSMIDCGVAIVHGHHAHVPQGFERHGDGIIFYGLGNFAVPPAPWRAMRNTLWSLGVVLDFHKHRLFDWHWVTFEIDQPSLEAPISVGRSSRARHAEHVKYIENCNRPFEDQTLFEAVWQEIALRAYREYGAKYIGFYRTVPDFVKRKIRHDLQALRKLGVPPPLRSSRQSDHLLWHHMFACESHRQMMATALGLIAGNILDVRTAEAKVLVDHMAPHTKKYYRENLDF